jgi:hypothetical protein
MLATVAVASVELVIVVGAALFFYRSMARGVRRATEGRSGALQTPYEPFVCGCAAF